MYSYHIEQAIKAATVLHDGQVRKGAVPIPYVSHLFTVAMIVADYSDTEDYVIAALLHDTLEDTDYTLEELHQDFGPTVANIVESVSEPQDTDKVEYTWQERKDQYDKQMLKASEGALMVCAADHIHNMRSMIEEYLTDHSRFINDFGGKLEPRLNHYQEVSNNLNRRLDNEIVAEFNHVFTEFKKFISDVKKTQESASA